MTDTWFVRNARDTQWFDSGGFGSYAPFEDKESRFPQLGINISVLAPGEPMTMYHREGTQEDFLVLDGECLLVVDGEERPLRRWDLFHCPPGVDHAIVGAGSGRSVVLAVGARPEGGNWVVYPVDAAAQRHGAGVAVETAKPAEAYPGMTLTPCPYQEGWLPE